VPSGAPRQEPLRGRRWRVQDRAGRLWRRDACGGSRRAHGVGGRSCGLSLLADGGRWCNYNAGSAGTQAAPNSSAATALGCSRNWTWTAKTAASTTTELGAGCANSSASSGTKQFLRVAADKGREAILSLLPFLRGLQIICGYSTNVRETLLSSLPFLCVL
jgi:hypothetical protein